MQPLPHLRDEAFATWLHDLARSLANRGATLYEIADLAVYESRYKAGDDVDDVAFEIISIKDPCHDEF